MPVTSVAPIARPLSGGSADPKTTIVDVTLSTYTASGETLTAAQLDLASKIIGVSVVSQPANGYVAQWDGTKLRLYRTGTAVSAALQEVPGGTSVAGVYRVRVDGV